MIETNGGSLGSQTYAGAIDDQISLILRFTTGAANGTDASCELRRPDGATRIATSAPGVPVPGTRVRFFAQGAIASFEWFDLTRRANTFPPVGCPAAHRSYSDPP